MNEKLQISPQRPVEEIAREIASRLIGDWAVTPMDNVPHTLVRECERLVRVIASALTAERERSEELEKALSLVMAQVACGNLVRETAHDMEPGWAMKQVPLVTALAKATALLLRDSGTPASEEPGE